MDFALCLYSALLFNDELYQKVFRIESETLNITLWGIQNFNYLTRFSCILKESKQFSLSDLLFNEERISLSHGIIVVLLLNRK